MVQPQPFAKVSTISQPLWQQGIMQVCSGTPIANLPAETFGALYEKAVLVMRPSLHEQHGYATDLTAKQRFALEFARIYWGNQPPLSHVAERLVKTR